MKTRRDFLKKTALFGASAFMPPSLLGQESDGNCSFSRETTSSMLVPMGDALKITGTFLDEISHDIPHQNWGEIEWDRDFRYMRDVGIDTVIMIRSGYRKFITYPSKHLLSKGCYMPSVDLLDMFLRLAEKYHMKFYFGLYDSGKYWDTGDLSWEIEDNKYVIDEVWDKYGEKYKSFGGWYISGEISRKTKGAIDAFRTMGKQCKDVSGGLPTFISPWIDGKKAVMGTGKLTKEDAVSVQEHEREWNEIFDGVHDVVDACAFQDGHIDYDELDAFFAVNKKLADKYGMQCWTNAETFDRDMPIDFLPIKFDKLRMKLETAKRIVKIYGDKFLHMDEQERLHEFRTIALKEKLAALKEDLEAFNVTFDVWFSEQTLHDADKIKEACELLTERGYMYEKDGALWLKATAYGDDKDRVVIRDNGVPTYLAADIAYHWNKFSRGFDRVINLWGADHHGYIARMKAAVGALGYDPEQLEVLILQMVSLYRNGELVKMSKRTGQSVTLNELIEEVGTDAARFFFAMRSIDSQLNFDLTLATEKSNENPVYYIQYAHARICSIMRQLAEENVVEAAAADYNLLTDATELELIKKLCEYQEMLELAAKERAVHRVAHYVHDLAGLFHSFYNQCRILGVDPEVQQARIKLVQATRHTIKHALNILGVSAPERM